MNQSEINELLKDSDLQDSLIRQPEGSRIIQKNKHQFHSNPSSDAYKDQEFYQFDQSKRTQDIKAKHVKDKSLVNDSYGAEEFQSYQQSRRTKEFNRSQQNLKKNRQNLTKQLKVIKQVPVKPTLDKNQKSQVALKLIKNRIQGIEQMNIKSNKQKSIQKKQNKHTAFTFTRLQQREKQLLFTSITQQNKLLKKQLSQKASQLSLITKKYHILYQQKQKSTPIMQSQLVSKKLSQLQQKYNLLLTERAKQKQSKKTPLNNMNKTQQDRFVIQDHQREEQLMNVIDKLKERLISTDKELRTLQQKMNQGLDFQQELQRKLKRVQQLELRLDKMGQQAEQDRQLIEVFKSKMQQQKNKIQQLQDEKNQLSLSLKRAYMSQVTNSDIMNQLSQVKHEKQLLQKSLRQLSLTFSQKMGPKKPIPKAFDIQDSSQLLNYK